MCVLTSTWLILTGFHKVHPTAFTVSDSDSPGLIQSYYKLSIEYICSYYSVAEILSPQVAPVKKRLLNQSSSKNRSLKHSFLKRLFLTKSVLSFLTAPVHEWPLRDYIQNLVLRKCYFRLILFSIKFELLLFLRKFSKIERLNLFTKRMLILIYCKIYFWDELRNSVKIYFFTFQHEMIHFYQLTSDFDDLKKCWVSGIRTRC